MNIEPEINEISERLNRFYNTVCTDDLVNYLGSKEAKTADMSKFDSKMSHREKIMALGSNKLACILNARGMNVSIRMSEYGYPIIESEKWKYTG